MYEGGFKYSLFRDFPAGKKAFCQIVNCGGAYGGMRQLHVGQKGDRPPHIHIVGVSHDLNIFREFPMAFSCDVEQGKRDNRGGGEYTVGQRDVFRQCLPQLLKNTRFLSGKFNDIFFRDGKTCSSKLPFEDLDLCFPGIPGKMIAFKRKKFYRTAAACQKFSCCGRDSFFNIIKDMGERRNFSCKTERKTFFGKEFCKFREFTGRQYDS